MERKKKVVVIGGPIAQKVDPVLQLVPTGKGGLADSIADMFEESFDVRRLGNFSNSEICDFDKLREEIDNFSNVDAVIFLAHLPNVLVEYSRDKIRDAGGNGGCIKYKGAEKLVSRVKEKHKKTLLVPFKLADPSMSKVEIIRWMLNLKSGLAVYSRLGTRGVYWIIDVFGNEIEVSKNRLPAALLDKLEHYLSAVRRQSVQNGENLIEAQYLPDFRNFIKRSASAFTQISDRNVETGRWPGNFSSRLGALTFLITRRNVNKSSLSQEDFVRVSLTLSRNCLEFFGNVGVKPSTDAPVHRVIYDRLPWVKHIVHGHLKVSVKHNFVHDEYLQFWPCGAENEGHDIVAVAPKESIPKLWVVNITGHGFIALIGDENPSEALQILASKL